MTSIWAFALAFWMFWFPQLVVRVPGPGGAVPSSSSPTWAFVQAADNFNCSASSTTCSVTVSATTSGSILVAADYQPSGYNGHIASGSGGGGTWTLCASTGCLASATGDLGAMDLAYNITGTGGATSISLTVSSAPSVAWGLAIDEWKCTANCGAIALDQSSRTATSSSCSSSCTAASFTGLAGTSDLLIQGINVDNSPGTITSPYSLDSTRDFAYALGSVQLTAPTVCQSTTGGSCGTPSAGAFQATAIAFK